MTNQGTHPLKMKTTLAGKNNTVKQFLLKASVETGAWLLSCGFFGGLVWLAGSMF